MQMSYKTPATLRKKMIKPTCHGFVIQVDIETCRLD